MASRLRNLALRAGARVFGQRGPIPQNQLLRIFAVGVVGAGTGVGTALAGRRYLQPSETSSGKSATEALLESAGQDLEGSVSAQDEKRTRALTPPSQTVYGEITFEGVRIFMEHCLKEEASSTPPDAERRPAVFYDLGSGIGRMVLQVHMDYPEVRRSVGVELSKERHDSAVELRRRVLGDTKDVTSADGRSCELRCADILKADLADATIIWLANSFMTEAFLRQLIEKLAKEAPHLQYVGVNDALSEWDLAIPGFVLDRQLRLPMTWDHEWSGCIYKRASPR